MSYALRGRLPGRRLDDFSQDKPTCNLKKAGRPRYNSQVARPEFPTEEIRLSDSLQAGLDVL